MYVCNIYGGSQKVSHLQKSLNRIKNNQARIFINPEYKMSMNILGLY